MIGLILATCVSASNCDYQIVESKPEWTTIRDCIDESPYTLLELGLIPTQNQRVLCEELRRE